MARADRKQTRLFWWVAQGAVLFAWWLLLVGTTDSLEVAAGVAAAVVGAIATQVTEEQLLARFLGRLDWVLQAWRLPKYVLTGCWEILTVLVQRLLLRQPAASLVLAVPFEACGDDEASATRRALAVAYTTMTPNFVVIGVDQDRREMLYHQLKKSDVPAMTRKLGARR